MSAYGTIARPSSSVGAGLLETKVFPLASEGKRLAVYHVQGADSVPRDLFLYLQSVFNAVLIEGKTYPQEEALDEQAFAAYYFAYDLFIGLVVESATVDERTSLEDARAGRSWEDAVGGYYYIKPNYPGRSSHNCNAGFVVPDRHRGLKIGMALGQSYLDFAPKLGYKASVFNLVYVTNKASLAIWKRLGFQQVGLIPGAGRLKTGPNGEEEYVDAAVIHKRFECIHAI